MKTIVKTNMRSLAPIVTKRPVKRAIAQTLLACLIVVLSMLAPAAHSQNGQDQSKISIAILPFVQSGGGADIYANETENIVTGEFVSRKRFTILDRSKFATVMKELDLQKQEEFLNSKDVVEQGHQLGAQYLVTGVLSGMNIEQKQVTSTTNTAVATTVSSNWNPLKKILNQAPAAVTQPVSETVYIGHASLSYQVIDVATGGAIYHENLTVTGNQFGDRSRVAENILCHLKHKVRQAILNEFPTNIAVLDVEEKDKHGAPKTILINAGTQMFTEGLAPESECDGGGAFDFGSWFKSRHDNPKLTLFETIIYTAAGKEYHREKPVAELEVTSVEGETSVCKVKDGEKALLDAMTNSKTLGIKIKQ